MSITYRVLKPGDEAALEAFVLPHIASSMFLLGNMHMSGLIDNGRPYTGTYAAAFDGDEIVGVMAHFWNANLIMQSPLEYLGDLWKTAVFSSKRPVLGIIGLGAQVEFALKSLEIEPDLIQIDDVENLYTLNLTDLIVPEALANGRLQGHRAESDDLDYLEQWRVEYNIEELEEEDSPELRHATRVDMMRYMHEGRVWILKESGSPVAMTAFNVVTTGAVQVGGVYTPPENRSKGYARAAVAASLLDARNEGVQTGILFTSVENHPAQKAYIALGFKRIGDYRITLLNRPFDPG